MEQIHRELKLARGILFRENEVLLVQDIRPGQGHYFLPGGSVEPGESVKTALSREWDEELGWKVEADSFVGCLENTWTYNRKQDGTEVRVFEINYLFKVKAMPENFLQEPISKESHLRFSWIPISSLSSLNLLPSPLKTMIPHTLETRPQGLWESTLLKFS